MRFLAILLTFVLAGCCGTPEFDRPLPTGEPWDTTHLIDLDPSVVSPSALRVSVAHAESRLIAATVDGVVWPRSRTDESKAVPDQFHSGGDSLLFSGISAASWCWKFDVTGDSTALDEVLKSVDGLHRMTHIAGPGVLCRNVFPITRAEEFQWPWPSREPFVGVKDGYGYYTRATRDQLTGLLVGLSWGWRTLYKSTDPRAIEALFLIVKITNNVYDRLEADDWKIRDENGTNDTGADDVDGLLKLNLLALVAVVNGDDFGLVQISEDIVSHLDSSIEGLISLTNRFNNYQQYFAHNLRATRMLTTAGLAPWLSADVYQTTRESANSSWWKYVKGHKSAWFDVIWMSLGGDDRTSQIRHSLNSLSLKPVRGWASPYAGQEQTPGILEALVGCTEAYVVDPHLRKPTNYTTWQKEPWDVGKPDPDGRRGTVDDIGLGMVSAYWLWRYTVKH